jgi:signal transduction histidine kinase
LLAKWYEQLPRSPIDSIIYWATYGVNLSHKHLNSAWGRAAYRQSQSLLGNTYRRAGKFSLAQNTFKQLIAQGKALKDSVLLSDGYSDLAYVFFEQEKDDSTIFYDLQALMIRKAIGSPKIGSSYNNLGFDYKISGQLRKGLFYYQQAINYKKAQGMEKNLGNSYMNVGNLYQSMGIWDSSLYYLNLALHHQQASEDSIFMAEALHNIGKTNLEAGNATKAEVYLQQAMATFKALKRDQHPRVVNTYHELARAYLALQKYNKAATLLDQSNAILLHYDKQIGFNMKYQLQIQEELAWANQNYEQARLFSAQRAALQDSLHQRTLKQKTYQLLTDYEDVLKVERIKTLEQQQEIDQLKYDNLIRQRLVLGGLLVLLIGIIFLLYRVNQWRSKVNEELTTLNATKDTLFSIIAHDLKNPLSAFRSITQSLSDSIFDISRDDLDYFMKQLSTSAHSLLELLQNLLYWSISQSGKLEFAPHSLALADTTQEVIDLLSGSALVKQLTVETTIDSSSQVWADAKMTTAILRNLLANAIKFTPNQGTITISSQQVEDKVMIRVQDTGTGIAPELIPTLFTLKPNQKRTSGKGTGLGLILCKELVEHQGGIIWLEQSNSQGSTFCFTLPASKPLA